MRSNEFAIVFLDGGSHVGPIWSACNIPDYQGCQRSWAPREVINYIDISDQVDCLERIRSAAPEESDAGGAASLPGIFSESNLWNLSSCACERIPSKSDLTIISRDNKYNKEPVPRIVAF
jgi:hypothetical protein